MYPLKGRLLVVSGQPEKNPHAEVRQQSRSSAQSKTEIKAAAATNANTAELTRLAQTPALRIGRFLERQGLMERDTDATF
jgi:hypothetical protein